MHLRLTVLMCVALTLTMWDFATYAALIPELKAAWAMTSTEAGWIASSFFLGYILAVPFLVGTTDRYDAKRVFLLGAALAMLASLGFAFLAAGPISATIFRTLSGIGLAGTYMPGLKILTDRLPEDRHRRAIAFYTAIFGIGTSISYFMAGLIGSNFAWPLVFKVAASGSGMAFLLVLLFVGPYTVTASLGAARRNPLDFRPVLRNSASLGYILAYAGHCWELFAFRAWLVAFLTFALATGAVGSSFDPAVMAGICALSGLPASILGAEWAASDRRRLIAIVMSSSFVFGCLFGFVSIMPAIAIVVAALAYNFVIMMDSAAITTGAVTSAPREVKGATMAVHSILGFLGGVIGPLVVGITLDLTGGSGSSTAWRLAFVAIGMGSLLGLIGLMLQREVVKSPVAAK